MSEKTEQPTDKKIRDARQKGQVLFSREIVAGALLIGLTTLFLLMWREFVTLATAMLEITFTQIKVQFSRAGDHRPDFQSAFATTLSVTLFFFIVVSASVYGVSIFISIVSNLAQVGFLFITEKIAKGAKSLNFINNAKQIFSTRNLFSFGLNLIKVTLISYVAYLITLSFIGEFFASQLCNAEQSLTCLLWSAGRSFAWLFAICAALYIPIAIVDFIIQRAFYLKELKMTKEEVKQEYKEMEGNPEIKAHRRQAHREILESNTLNAVKQASVIIKNPTHYAVALLYDEEKTPLPLVIGKGEGALAQEMIRIAEQENIPVYEDVQLARGLFEDAELGHYITSDFIAPIAEVLHYIQQAKENL